MPLSVYSYCQHHCRAVDVDVDDVRALRDLGEVEDRRRRWDGHDREDQERDDRPADLEHDVAVGLHRAAVLARLLPEPQRHEDRRRRTRRRRPRPRPRRTGVIRFMILCAAGPGGLQRVLVVVRPGAAAAREHDDGSRHADGGHGPAPEPLHAVQHLPSLDGAGSSGVPAARRLYMADSPDRNSVIRSPRDSRMLRARAGRATTARRCQSRSTRTWVSRCTRTPSSASSSRRASVPGLSEHRAALADHDALLRVALDADDQRGTRAAARPWSSRSSTSSVVTAIECGSSSCMRAEQLLAQQLGGEERLGLIADDAVGVVVRALRHPGLELADQRVDALRRSAPTAGRTPRSPQLAGRDGQVLGDLVAGSARSILLTTSTTGVPHLRDELGDEAVAGADRLRSRRSGSR